MSDVRADTILGRTERKARLVVLTGTLMATAACSADEPELKISGLHACDVLDAAQLAAIGVDHVSQRSPASGAQGSSAQGSGAREGGEISTGYSRCTWKSSAAAAWSSVSVSLEPSRDNSWVGKKGKTEPVSGFRASLLGYQMSIAAGSDRGVVGIELLRAKKPIREIAGMVVENLRPA